MVEAFVARAHVADDRDSTEPVGHDDARPGGGRRLGLLLRLLRLSPRRLAGGPLLLDLALQLLDLLLRLAELLLEDAEPLFGGGLGARITSDLHQREKTKDECQRMLHRLPRQVSARRERPPDRSKPKEASLRPGCNCIRLPWRFPVLLRRTRLLLQRPRPSDVPTVEGGSGGRTGEAAVTVDTFRAVRAITFHSVGRRRLAFRHKPTHRWSRT